MALLLKNVRCIDPAQKLDQVCNIAIKDGVIIEVSPTATIAKGVERDLTGKIAFPGLVDMHVHLRDPGQEYKEDIQSGSRAAAAGGFTDICPMPNTQPVCDSGSRVAYIKETAAEVAKTRVHPVGALTKELKGESLAEIGDMHKKGAVAFSDDGRGVQDNKLARFVFDYVKQFNKPVLVHCQLEDLVGKGVVNEGVVSTRLGLAGWPAAGEELAMARDIALAELTGCALHIQHVTTAKGIALVQAAKEKGLPVSAEVSPHHLFLSEDDLDTSYNTHLKVNPPLRTKEDCLALQEALIAGIIDCLSSDHAPHAAHEKALEFENAPFGTTGLETSLALMLTHLVNTGRMSYEQLVERMAHQPRKILGLEAVSLVAGSKADITIIDPEIAWTAGAKGWQSKSANSAFAGHELLGKATDVYVGGYASLENEEVV